MSLLIGIVCIVASGFGATWVGKREFERRNVAGVEEHASFGAMVKTKTLENFVKFLSGICGFIGLISLVVFVAGCM